MLDLLYSLIGFAALMIVGFLFVGLVEAIIVVSYFVWRWRK